MKKPAQITDAEWVVMQALWDQDRATASAITAAVRRERTVSAQTVKTLLRRLVDKHLVDYEIDADDSRVYHYRALITRDDAIRQKSAAFIAQVHGSDVGAFLAYFVENSELSDDELLRLQQKVAKHLGKKS